MGLRFSPGGLRFSSGGLRFSQGGIRFSPRVFVSVHGVLGLRSSFQKNPRLEWIAIAEWSTCGPSSLQERGRDLLSSGVLLQTVIYRGLYGM